MTYRKITITLMLCCFNLVGFGQLSKYSIVKISERFGINKSGWNNYQIQITPPIFNSLSEFNPNGLSVAKRTVPLFSTSGYKDRDTTFWSQYFTDKYLSGYKIFDPDTNDFSDYVYLTNGVETQRFESSLFPCDEVIYSSGDDYMDQFGSYYLNLFPGFGALNW